MSNAQFKRFINLYTRLADEFFKDPNIDEMVIEFKESILLRENELELIRSNILQRSDELKTDEKKINDVVFEDYFYKENEKVLVKMGIRYKKEEPRTVRVVRVKFERV